MGCESAERGPTSPDNNGKNDWLPRTGSLRDVCWRCGMRRFRHQRLVFSASHRRSAYLRRPGRGSRCCLRHSWPPHPNGALEIKEIKDKTSQTFWYIFFIDKKREKRHNKNGNPKLIVGISNFVVQQTWWKMYWTSSSLSIYIYCIVCVYMWKKEEEDFWPLRRQPIDEILSMVRRETHSIAHPDQSQRRWHTLVSL